MRRRLLLVLASAAAVGLLTGVLVYRTISQKVARDAGQQPTEELVVAAVNMELGEALTRQHIKLASWPKATVPQGTLRSLAEAEGLVARTSIVAGEPMLEAKLLDPKRAAQGGLLPMLVPEGLRGVTIKVDKAVEESGFIQPNSRVDVLASMDSKGGDRIAKVILQNVPVLAAGQTVETKDNRPVKITTVTLALTPEQAERLALAQSLGRIMLATRNFGDDESIPTVGATRAALLGSPPSTPKANSTEADGARVSMPAVETHMVSVLRAGQVTDYSFVRDAARAWVAANPR